MPGGRRARGSPEGAQAMTVLVDGVYLEAGRRVANEHDALLRERFRKAFGPEEGDRMVDAMVSRMRDNIRSDSGSDPAPGASGEEAA